MENKEIEKVEKVNKIIISDSYVLEDLIIFDENVEIEEVKKVIQEVRNNIGDYAFDDIYDAILKRFKVKKTIDLTNTWTLFY